MSDVSKARQRGADLQRAGNAGQLPIVRIYVSCTFTADFIAPFLTAAFVDVGMWPEVKVGPYGQMAQEMLGQQSSLYRHQPDLVVAILAAEDLLSPIYQRPASMNADEQRQFARERSGEVRSWLSALNRQLPAAVIQVVPFGTDRVPCSAVLRGDLAECGQHAIDGFLSELGALGAGASQFVSVDWDVEVRRSGWDALRDERLWYLARSRLGPAGWFALANRVRDYWLAYHGDARKVVAVDLDDTLWGGVVGEVGLQGIELGNEALGLAFQDLQRELLKWNDAGVLLTIVSKNNAADALAVFDQHPGMILKRDHFAAMRINWQDKATNLQELAEELNVAIDSFVFLDDNPVEREWVRRVLPGVVVPDLPSELTARPDFLRRLTHFNRVAVTEADRKRLGSYQFQHKRRELQASAVSMSDYLGSLDQAVRFDPITPATIARAAQMCQRTNQFNLTTRRYTVADLQAMLADERVEIVSLCVADRFEDYGIVGLAILRHASQSAELDSFLMSCRVLGRRIEFEFLNEMLRRARARGAERLTGRYLSTAKNAQVVDFLNNAGVTLHSDGAFVVVGVENVH